MIMFHRRKQRGGIYRGSRRQQGGIFRGSRRQRGGQGRRRRQKRYRHKLQKGGIIPALIPLIAAGITTAGGIGASAAHAAISRNNY